MNLDANTNMVVFEVVEGSKVRRVVGRSKTRDLEGIQNLWAEIKQQEEVYAAEVRRVYSEWEPSPSDALFLTRRMRNAAVTWSFKRPRNDEDWPKALADVQAVLVKNATKVDGNLLPVLRERDALSSRMVKRPVAAGLVMCLAKVGETSRGTVGIDYVLKEPDEAWGADVWDRAIQNAARGCRITGLEQDGEPFLVVQREGGLSTAVLADPRFGDKAAVWLKTGRFFAGWSTAHDLTLWPADSGLAPMLTEKVLSGGKPGAVNLDPGILLHSNGQFQLHARAPKPAH